MLLPCPFCRESIEVPRRSQQAAALPVTSPVSPGPGNGDGRRNEGLALKSGRMSDRRRRTEKEGARQTVLPPGRASRSKEVLDESEAASRGGTGDADKKGASAFDLEHHDLEWEDHLQADREPEDTDQVKRAEIRRLAAMMHPDQSLVDPTVTGRRGTIAFRCVSCGHVISVPKGMEGQKVDCGNCRAVVDVPVQRREGEDSGTKGVPAKAGKLPERRSEALRTVDDMRQRRSEPTDSAARGASREPLAENDLEAQFQDLIRRELERLQAASPKTEEVENAARRRPPPPLAEHGEVIPTSRTEGGEVGPQKSSKGSGAERRKRILPEARGDSPLTNMATLDPIDLDSEVAKHWGASAVVNTKRLNWIAILLIASVIAAAVALGFWHLMQSEQLLAGKSDPLDAMASENAAAEATTSGPVEVRLKGLLAAFHQASTVEAKATYVRDAAAVLPLMRAYYAGHDLEPRSLNSDLFEASPFRVGTTTFYRVEGEYQNLRPFYGEVEETRDGILLLDWKSWVAHGETAWDTFITQGVETPTEFRVIAHRGGLHVAGYSDAEKYLGYTLRNPHGGLMYGYAPRDSDAGKNLERLFNRIEGEGIKRARVTVMIRFDPEKDKEKAQVLIDQLKADHWADTSPSA